MNPTDDYSQDSPPRASAARRRADLRERRGQPERPQGELREPGQRLSERWVPEPPARIAPGDRLPIHPDAIRELKPKNPVRTGPNAPLLMRIVRSPYALAPVGHLRVAFRDPKLLPEPREALGQPGRAWREARAELTLPNPIRAFPHRPEPRPHPRRLASVAEDIEGGDA